MHRAVHIGGVTNAIQGFAQTLRPQTDRKQMVPVLAGEEILSRGR